MLCEVCPYPPAQLLLDLISSAKKFWQLFTIFFGAAFWGLLVSKIGHSWYRWKSWDVFFPMVLSLNKSELGWESYGSQKQGCPSSFSLPFRWRFQPNRRCYRRTESCLLYLRLSSFLKFLTYWSTHSESGRLCAWRWSPGWKNVLDFQHNFLTFIDFPAHGWRIPWCQFSMILVSMESSWCLLLECHKSCEDSSLGLWDTALWTETTRVIFVVRSHLPIKISA